MKSDISSYFCTMFAVCVNNMFSYCQVIPRGMEFNHIIPHDGDMDANMETTDRQASPDPSIWIRSSHSCTFIFSLICFNFPTSK